MGDPRELPILFNGEMVRAILDGRKTQTRRPVKPQPEGFGSEARVSRIASSTVKAHRGQWSVSEPHEYGTKFTERGRERDVLIGRPAYDVGDLLYVRETFALHRIHDSTAPSKVKPSLLLSVAYHATGDAADGRCRPSIHMPKWAARIWLRVTGVRVERVRDISADDVRAEGFPFDENLGGYRFTDTWEAAYPGSWDRNDWVWVYEFEHAEAPR